MVGREPPGWYADPSGRHVFRFWDGARWTDRIGDGPEAGRDPIGASPPAGSGSSGPTEGTSPQPGWGFAALPPPAGTSGPNRFPPAAARRSRKGWLIAAIAGVTLMILLGVVVVGVGLNAALTHDLVTAEFNSSPAPFNTGNMQTYVFELQNGTYAVIAKPGLSDRDEAALSRGQFARVAYVADLSVDIVSINHPADTVVAIGCDEAVPNGAMFDAGFLFVVGHSQYTIVRFDPSTDRTPASWDAKRIATVDQAPSIQAGDTLALRCSVGPLDQGTATLAASVNGKDVIHATSPVSHNGAGFLAMNLGFVASQPGDSVHFDHAIARVPE